MELLEHSHCRVSVVDIWSLDLPSEGMVRLDSLHWVPAIHVLALLREELDALLEDFHDVHVRSIEVRVILK